MRENLQQKTDNADTKAFRFLADTIIYAKNIDDCFSKLANHFKNPSESNLEHCGTLKIEPNQRANNANTI